MEPQKNKTKERPPIIAVLGHVDHGKSTLLDYIREANTVDSEAGGITQHVAAYEVEHTDTHKNMQRITFLDTPGHEAFGAIRSRCASIADIAILIVSAEDGVKPQTLEALQVIRSCNTPFVVAVNKIDKDGANAEKTISSLAEHEVYLEGRGGDVPFALISAKTGQGIDELLELVLLVAEMEEFTGDPSVPAEGFVVESHRDPKKGTSGTLIVSNGTLKVGMHVAAGKSIAPVRIMEDFMGRKLEAASFSTPIQIIGWNELPAAGTCFVSFSTKKEAEAYAASQADEKRDIRSAVIEEEDEDDVRAIVPLIIKADVASTIDAIEHELQKLEDERILVKIVRAEVGDITENDIKAAGGDDRSIILGFNTSVDAGVPELAERAGITVKTFSIIYELTEWLSEVLAKRRPIKKVERTVGNLEVLKLFSKSGTKQVIGGRVTEGTIAKGNEIHIERRGEDLGRATILEIQVAKSKASSVNEGNECGIELKSSVAIEERDNLVVKGQVEV